MNEKIKNKKPVYESAGGLEETGQRYFERENAKGFTYTIISEDNESIEIKVRPGLANRMIAAGVAFKYGKNCKFLHNKEKLEITPEEAKILLEQKIGDFLGL